MTWAMAAFLTLSVALLTLLPLRTGGGTVAAGEGGQSRESLNEEIERTLALWYCPDCGFRLDRPNQRHCSNCGALLDRSGGVRPS